MGRFALGFVVASVLWGAAWAAQLTGLLPSFGATEPEITAVPSGTLVKDDKPGAQGPRRRRRRIARRRQHDPAGHFERGDLLDDGSPRELNAGEHGGEQQLPASQIEAAFDGASRAIRRCLVLVDTDQPAVGTLRFGLRIAGSGRVTKANLSGPAAVTQGEPGACLERVARSLSFPTFDGPDMVVKYPITLE